MNPNDAPLPEVHKVNRSELVAWYNGNRSSKVHAFITDPEVGPGLSNRALCSDDIRANSQRHPYGNTCLECERLLRILHSHATKYKTTGFRVGYVTGLTEARGLPTK